jgi:hypothetical protein
VLNWLSGPIKNPQHGDCFFNADESIICVFLDGNWYNAGSIPDDLSELNEIVSTFGSRKRDEKIKIVIDEHN